MPDLDAEVPVVDAEHAPHLQLVGIAMLLAVAGVFMEYLRNAGILPWSAP